MMPSLAVIFNPVIFSIALRVCPIGSYLSMLPVNRSSFMSSDENSTFMLYQWEITSIRSCSVQPSNKKLPVFQEV